MEIAKHPERSALGIDVEAGTILRAQSKDAHFVCNAFFDCVRLFDLRECRDPNPHSAQNA